MKINIAKSTLKFKKNNKRINIITSEKKLFESSFKNKTKKNRICQKFKTQKLDSKFVNAVLTTHDYSLNLKLSLCLCVCCNSNM